MKGREWEKVRVIAEGGREVEAQAPVVVSASRATDVPAFYAEWFMERLRRGYVRWRNPFSGRPLYVSFARTRFIVFWSKAPEPMVRHLAELDGRGWGTVSNTRSMITLRRGWSPTCPRWRRVLRPSAV